MTGGVVAAAASSAIASSGAWALRTVAPGRGSLERTNFRGRTVTLWGGVAANAGMLVGTMTTAVVAPANSAALVAVGAAGVLGTVDDLIERPGGAMGPPAKGLRGHMRALRRGRLTTGAAKLLGIPLAGCVCAALMASPPPPTGPARGGRPRRIANVLVAGGVIAGSANAVNLLDLRPGRAAKAVVLVSGLQLARRGPGSPLAAIALTVAATGLARDLAEEGMLGDGGANALGALLGTAAVRGGGDLRLRVDLLALAALTLASERVSFSSVISANPLLRRIDSWGRLSPAEGDEGRRSEP